MKDKFIQITEIEPDLANPEARLLPDQGLVDSIIEVGLLNPLIVMDAGKNNEGKHNYIIVAGHRRYAALKQIDATTHMVPCRVVSDTADIAQMRLMQLAENLQREDLLPRDEAIMLARMDDIGPMDVAKRLGKDPAYVARRMQLGDSPIVLAALEKGQLTVHLAMAIAALPSHLHKAALRRYKLANFYDEEEAAQELAREYLMKLKDAPWDLKDENLVKKAGSCKDCRKVTSADKLLFEKGPVCCVDVVCWNKKTAAQEKLNMKLASGNGKLREVALRDVDYSERNKYLLLSSCEHGFKAPDAIKRTVGELLIEADKKIGGDSIERILVKDYGNKPALTVDKKAFLARVRKGKADWLTTDKEVKFESQKANASSKLTDKINALARHNVDCAIAEAIFETSTAGFKTTADMLAVFIQAVDAVSWNSAKDVCTVLGLKKQGKEEWYTTLDHWKKEKLKGESPNEELLALAVFITQLIRGGSNSSGMRSLALVYGVDEAKLKREAKKELTDKFKKRYEK